MDTFLKSVERQAYRMALIGTGNEEDALDIVQESMLRFVAKYAHKPEAEWKALFYRITHNQLRDFYRRQSRRGRWMTWLKTADDGEDPIQGMPDPHEQGAEHALKVSSAFARLEQELHALPFRQQQAFLLRAWEGLSVSETAAVMNCSEGSVKTHYFRAQGKLREKLGDCWP